MEFDITLNVILISMVAFFFAGFIDSVAGGAGFITVPSLLLLGIPPHFTLGTGKLATSIGSVTATYVFWKNGMVVKKLVPVGVLTAALGAISGASIALHLDSSMMGKVIVIMLPLAIILTSCTGGFSLSEGELPKEHFWLKVVLIGYTIGLYEGFFGPGAGTFFTIALHVVMKMNMVKASGTSKLFNIAANFGAFCTFATEASVLYAVAIPCAVASMIGNTVGAHFAVKVGAKFVRNIMFVVLAIMMGSLAYKYFFAA